MRSLAPAVACCLLVAWSSAPAQEVPAPADPPPPEHLGKPIASLAAAPAFWERPLSLLPTRAQPYAPESPDAGALFARASAERSEPGALSGATLACEIVLDERRFDERAPFDGEESARGDIAAVAGVTPDRKKPPPLVVATYGPEDSNAVTFLLPLASLKVGDTLWIHLLDADVSAHDDLETLRVRYAGEIPIALRGRAARGECRLVPRPSLEAALAQRLASLADRVQELSGGVRPDFLAGVVVGVDALLADARGSAEDAAALVGWDDPRVAAWVRRLGEIEAAAARAFAEAFAALRGNALGPAWTRVPASELSLRVDELRCGPGRLGPARALVAFPQALPADGCALQLSVRNGGVEAVELEPSRVGPLRDLALVSARGRYRALNVEGTLVQGRARRLGVGARLGPGQAVTLLAVPEVEDDVLRRASLPILLRGAGPVFFAVPEPAPAPRRPSGRKR